MISKTNLHYKFIFSFLSLYGFCHSSYGDASKTIEMKVKRAGLTAVRAHRLLGVTSGVASISSFYLAWQNYKNLLSRPVTEDTGELADAVNKCGKSIGRERVARFIGLGLVTAIPAILLHKCPRL